jgi:hypothetical protein
MVSELPIFPELTRSHRAIMAIAGFADVAQISEHQNYALTN